MFRWMCFTNFYIYRSVSARKMESTALIGEEKSIRVTKLAGNSVYFNGTELELRVAPNPGALCFTGLHVGENSPSL